ncbi:NTP transferase domain-containing protein [Citreimonas salinaria]|uniref:Molybdopterin-guanine dinucleotide biosynthesis protein A n=1 Tax=Citreimonas salinaria TaxID=321339 RepID=A0A1H3HQ40_9RHOB|nr:NTP transferase domain-containing protein [Citreimonas salinaria]SDY17593.1 molybdopterin-guanine dinucleotide biosynthesis protein A [Citreimonas salinaria]
MIPPAGLVLDAAGDVDAVCAALAPQVSVLAVHSNADVDTTLPVLRDLYPERPGLLAGVLAGLEWAAAQGFEQLVTVPADAQVPPDLVARLQDAAAQAGPVPIVASTGAGRVVAIALWPVIRTERIRSALATGQRDASAVIDALGGVELALGDLPPAPEA